MDVRPRRASGEGATIKIAPSYSRVEVDWVEPVQQGVNKPVAPPSTPCPGHIQADGRYS
jgi:hypothetical protein